MARARQKKLEESVALAGPYLEQRLRALRTGVDVFRAIADTAGDHSRVRCRGARRALKGLPQMGEGGAYRMLLFAADHPVLPVDARVSRVARRLGYGEAQDGFAKTARARFATAVIAELPAGRQTHTVAPTCISITTAPRRAPKPIRTATSVRCSTIARRERRLP